MEIVYFLLAPEDLEFPHRIVSILIHLDLKKTVPLTVASFLESRPQLKSSRFARVFIRKIIVSVEGIRNFKVRMIKKEPTFNSLGSETKIPDQLQA